MEALGINPVLLIAQLISFSVLVLVLNRFLYKKIKQSLEERRELIKKTISHELETEKRIKALEEERLDLKTKNQTAVKTLLVEAKKDAEVTKKEILAEAEVKAKKMIAGAQSQSQNGSELKVDVIVVKGVGGGHPLK